MQNDLSIPYILFFIVNFSEELLVRILEGYQ